MTSCEFQSHRGTCAIFTSVLKKKAVMFIYHLWQQTMAQNTLLVTENYTTTGKNYNFLHCDGTLPLFRQLAYYRPTCCSQPVPRQYRFCCRRYGWLLSCQHSYYFLPTYTLECCTNTRWLPKWYITLGVHTLNRSIMLYWYSINWYTYFVPLFLSLHVHRHITDILSQPAQTPLNHPNWVKDTSNTTNNQHWFNICIPCYCWGLLSCKMQCCIQSTLEKEAAGSYKQDLSASLPDATFQMTDIVIFTTMKTYSQQASWYRGSVNAPPSIFYPFKKWPQWLQLQIYFQQSRSVGKWGNTCVSFVWRVELHQWANGNQHLEKNTFSWNRV
jgi:hypothetical protein